MKNTIIRICILLIFSACTKEYSVNVEEPAVTEEITAVIDDIEKASKTSLAENNSLVWSIGDEIRVYTGAESWKSYKLKETSAGRSQGTFSLTSYKQGADKFYAGLVIYPATSASYVNMEANSTLYSIVLNLPETQTYNKNSFASGAFPMTATWNLDNTPISFYNILGAIKIKLRGNKKIKSVTITGHNNESLSGKANIQARDNIPELISFTNGKTHVTLDCGENGVQLLENESKEFIITLPPVEFSKGFNIKVTDIEGKEYIRDSWKYNKISRSSILTMPLWDFEESDEDIIFEDAVIKELCVKAFDLDQDGELSKNEAAAVTDLSKMMLTKKTFKTFNELKYFTGVRIIPENYFKGIALRSITFPEGLTEIGQYAFYQCTSLKEIEIRGDIGYAAFANCSNLNKVTFTGSTKTIDSYAFQDCISLTDIVLPTSLTRIGIGSFIRCKSLKEITIPTSVKSIGDIYNGHSFSNCTNLTKVDLGNISNIPRDCFSGCSSLETVIFSEQKNLTIKEYAFSTCESLSELSIPGNPSVEIKDYAFANCKSLTDLECFHNITGIGKYAFQNCSELKTANISGTVNTISDHAFLNCSSLVTLRINEGTTTIDNYAFEDCIHLTDVILPNSLTNIHTGVFSGCTSLETIQLPDITTLSRGAFFNCGLRYITLPESLSEISEELFQSCDKLESVTIPESITSIGEEAFEWCKSLKSIVIPESVSHIGRAAFSECISIKEIIIPESVTGLGESIFEKCSSLERATIPESLNILPNSTFSECYSLRSITIPQGISTIGNEAFYDCYNLESINIPESVTQIGNGTFAYCESLNKLVLPESMEKIGRMAFEGCIGLRSITIPYGISNIETSLFNKCSSLTEIILPESITKIGSSEFQSCSGLTKLTIPSSVVSISDYMFSGCTSLATLIFLPPNVPSGGGSNMFKNCSNIPRILVPAASVDAYKSASYWKTYKDKIFSIN